MVTIQKRTVIFDSWNTLSVLVSRGAALGFWRLQH